MKIKKIIATIALLSFTWSVLPAQTYEDAARITEEADNLQNEGQYQQSYDKSQEASDTIDKATIALFYRLMNARINKTKNDANAAITEINQMGASSDNQFKAKYEEAVKYFDEGNANIGSVPDPNTVPQSEEEFTAASNTFNTVLESFNNALSSANSVKEGYLGRERDTASKAIADAKTKYNAALGKSIKAGDNNDKSVSGALAKADEALKSDNFASVQQNVAAALAGITKAEADAKAAAEAAAAKAAAEAEAKRKAEEAARQKAAEEARLKAEQEAKAKAEAEAKAKAEAEAKAKAEQEAKLKAEQEAKAKAEAEAKAKAEQEAKLKAEQEAKAKAEAEAKAKAAEEAKLKAEQEAKAKAEAEAKAKAEQEAKLKAEQEAKAKAEQEAKLKAEQEAKAKAEAEAAAKAAAEAEAKRKAEEAARQKAAEEARLKAEQEAKAKAEAEAKRKAEEAARAKQQAIDKARQDINNAQQKYNALISDNTITRGDNNDQNISTLLADANRVLENDPAGASQKALEASKNMDDLIQARNEAIAREENQKNLEEVKNRYQQLIDDGYIIPETDEDVNLSQVIREAEDAINNNNNTLAEERISQATQTMNAIFEAGPKRPIDGDLMDADLNADNGYIIDANSGRNVNADGKVTVLPMYYVVVQRTPLTDALWRIAGYSYIYNDPIQWYRLYQANRNVLRDPNNPDLILPGQILTIPSMNGEERAGTYDPTLEYLTYDEAIILREQQNAQTVEAEPAE
ncbi:hypothetical protein [uncultured Brachyspira sp.]|uniref:LysM peptidoglycan-binding domain-containing protein n=1 Tax=uncultured Brachyspira sp. TaxID=221953 RepID=UPI00261EC031|nr:hypothetical protein [uncultured Brachyspira sp.]